MYGSETWAMKVEDTQKLKTTEASMMCGVSLKKNLSNEALRGKLGIDCISINQSINQFKSILQSKDSVRDAFAARTSKTMPST